MRGSQRERSVRWSQSERQPTICTVRAESVSRGCRPKRWSAGSGEVCSARTICSPCWVARRSLTGTFPASPMFSPMFLRRRHRVCIEQRPSTPEPRMLQVRCRSVRRRLPPLRLAPGRPRLSAEERFRRFAVDRGQRYERYSLPLLLSFGRSLRLSRLLHPVGLRVCRGVHRGPSPTR